MTDNDKLRVIIADDEPIVCIDIASTLEGLNYKVEGVAHDGFDAIELCKKFHPDIAIMDVKMPIFDGLSAASEIIANNLATAVVLLTAYSDNDIIKSAGDIGITGYLVKPVDEKSIKPTLEMAYSARKSILEKADQAVLAERKLQEKTLIDRAKFSLSKRENIAEGEAYRYIQQCAMDKRVSMLDIAKSILKQDTLK